MNYLLLSVVLVSLWISTLAGGTNEHSMLESYINRKCTDPQAKVVYGRVVTVMTELEHAFSYIPDQMEHFCKVEKVKLENLTKSARIEFKKCVSSNEAFLPLFLYNNFLGFLHFFCSEYAKNVRELYTPEGQLCLADLRKPEATKEVNSCFGEIIGPKSSSFVTKNEMCRNLNITRDCFQVVIGHHCAKPLVLQSLNEKLFDDNIATVCKIRTNSAESFKTEVLWLTFIQMLIFWKLQ